MWNSRLNLGVVLLLPALVIGCANRPGEAPLADAAAGEPQLQSALLVQADWLAANIENPNLVLLHVGADEAEYRSAHIPGARFVPISALNREKNGVPNMLPPREEIAAAFAAAGVSSGSHVVVYGAPLRAARAFVALEHLGHQRVSLLDGGMAAWRTHGEIAAGGNGPPARGDLRAAGGEEVIVDAGWVLERLGNPQFPLIDARPNSQYTGEESTPGIPRPGHIPGADNLFWEELLVSTDQPRLKDEATLRAMFRERGASPELTVVTYCRTGMQASFAYFVSRYLGYETRMYDGSFADWSPRTELPVERGGRVAAN